MSVTVFDCRRRFWGVSPAQTGGGGTCLLRGRRTSAVIRRAEQHQVSSNLTITTNTLRAWHQLLVFIYVIWLRFFVVFVLFNCLNFSYFFLLFIFFFFAFFLFGLYFFLFVFFVCFVFVV